METRFWFYSSRAASMLDYSLKYDNKGIIGKLYKMLRKRQWNNAHAPLE